MPLYRAYASLANYNREVIKLSTIAAYLKITLKIENCSENCFVALKVLSEMMKPYIYKGSDSVLIYWWHIFIKFWDRTEIIILFALLDFTGVLFLKEISFR